MYGEQRGSRVPVECLRPATCSARRDSPPPPRCAGLAIVDAVAEGNALGKGPVVFGLPPAIMQHVLAAAAAGDPGFCALRLNMYR